MTKSASWSWSSLNRHSSIAVPVATPGALNTQCRVEQASAGQDVYTLDVRLIAIGALLLMACSGEYDVVVSFTSADARADATRLQVAIVDDCSRVNFEGPLVAALRSVEFGANEGAAPIGELAEGEYGLVARAWNDQCELVAAGCEPIRAEAGGDGLLQVELFARSGAVCAATQTCESGRCAGGADSGADGGYDAMVVDAGIADAIVAVDAGCVDGAMCGGGRGICMADFCCEGCIDGDECRRGEPVGICEPFVVPERIFFVGNSFTLGGPIPTMVRDLAVSAGFPEPLTEYRAVGGQTLGGHRSDGSAESAAIRIAEGWDVVVLQEHSLRATSAAGDPEAFKEDATWFHDRILDGQADAQVVLFQTWARHPDHAVYSDGTFIDDVDMMSQIRAAYTDAVMNFIPMNSVYESRAVVSPIGDAWELHLDTPDALRLHGSDDYHAGINGRYLTALTIYSTIYGTVTTGLSALGLDAADALQLQRSVDSTTGFTREPPVADPPAIDIDDSIRLDFGPLMAAGWNFVAPTNSQAGPLATDSGAETLIRVSTTGFGGVQEGGESENDFMWPADVSRDSIWVGTGDGHEAALGLSAQVTFAGLADGRYRVEVFGSRSGDDAGLGRRVRVSVGSESADYDSADNRSEIAVLEGLEPEAGSLQIRLGVSPDGSARYAHLGAIVLTRTGD